MENRVEFQKQHLALLSYGTWLDWILTSCRALRSGGDVNDETKEIVSAVLMLADSLGCEFWDCYTIDKVYEQAEKLIEKWQ